MEEHLGFEEEEKGIFFHQEEVDIALDEAKISAWLQATIAAEGKALTSVNIILVTDPALLEINKEHLNHNYFTDIITFDYSDSNVEGDLYISVDTVRDNAKDYGVTFEHELNRVMVHGVLHLIGYKDKNDADQAQMTAKENEYLGKL